jgi:hypothetical protein
MPAADDGGHAERDATVEVLAKDEPGQERREHALEIQEQRGGGGGSARQAQHQQDGAAAAARRNGEPEPDPVLTLEGCLGPCAARTPEDGDQAQQAQPRSEVEHAGEKPGVDFAQEELGERRAGAEQRRRQERGADTARKRARPARSSPLPFDNPDQAHHNA